MWRHFFSFIKDISHLTSLKFSHKFITLNNATGFFWIADNVDNMLKKMKVIQLLSFSSFTNLTLKRVFPPPLPLLYISMVQWHIFFIHQVELHQNFIQKISTHNNLFIAAEQYFNVLHRFIITPVKQMVVIKREPSC